MAIKTFTTGEVLTAADTNTYLANSGLVYIASSTVTSGSSLSISSCFNSSFQNYKVIISNCKTTGAASSNIVLRSGSTDATSSYYYNGTYMTYTSATVNGINGSNVANWDSTILTSTSMVGASFDLFNPFAAEVTSIVITGGDPRTGGGGLRYLTGMHNANTSYNGFTFTTGSTFTSCTATVYGYRNL